MKLSIKERIELPVILPEKSSFEKLIIKRDLLSKIDFTQEEIEKFKISSTEDGRVSWFIPNGETDVNEYELTALESKFLLDILKDLDSKEELPETFIEIYKQLK